MCDTVNDARLAIFPEQLLNRSLDRNNQGPRHSYKVLSEVNEFLVRSKRLQISQYQGKILIQSTYPF